MNNKIDIQGQEIVSDESKPEVPFIVTNYLYANATSYFVSWLITASASVSGSD